ncbi:fatty acid-binding protein homolog 5-like [Ostrea edulis]|uniref:fatty acid-binding protein homolog 5-like n=1 Tax=Ostrea edulis TaxID=37623 RepID=UPI002094BD3D|nr:fatty acid-binding protein homolog 5-like [Ostrea edulis]
MEDIKSRFEGKWQCVKTENIESYLEARGVNIIKRKAAAQFKPIQTISVKDGKVEIIRKVPIKEIRHEFVLDEENDIVDDDNKFKAKLTYSDGKMTVNLKSADGKSKDNVIVREIEGDNLIVTATCNGVSAKSTFKKS